MQLINFPEEHYYVLCKLACYKVNNGRQQVTALWWPSNRIPCCCPSVRHLVESSWNVMAHGDAREGKWRGNWRMEWVASTLHTTSEHGVSSITPADSHTSAASSRLNWRPRRFKWTSPFRRKTKSGFCACAITFQTQSTTSSSHSDFVTNNVAVLCAFRRSQMIDDHQRYLQLTTINVRKKWVDQDSILQTQISVVKWNTFSYYSNWCTQLTHTSLLCKRAIAHPYSRLVCRHNIDHVIKDEHNRIITVVLAKHEIAPWWWFLREPKHFGILIVLIFLWFYNFVHQLE
jgi:hypothetical protein